MKLLHSISTSQLAAVVLFMIFLLPSCSEDDMINPDDENEFGQTPAEYIQWLEDNGVDYFLDQFGNPYTSGQKMIRFENGFDQQKLEMVINEIAMLNQIDPSEVTVENCGCGSEDFVMVQYEERLDASLNPLIGGMGDPDGNNDGLTDETSEGISASNNYYMAPLPQNLNQAGDMPQNFGPPDQGTGMGFLADDERIVIAVLDSGLDFDHPGLQMYDNFRLWRPAPEDCYELGYDFVDQVPFAVDYHGHGTQVTGVILETLKNYDVPVAIMPLKISDENGSVTLWDLFCAMAFAVTHGADIVNISAGWYGGPNPIIQKLIDDHPDVLFVCSAGNDGVNTDMIENGHFPSGYTYFPNVISTGALDADRTALASYSNYGPNSISIAAPGTELLAMNPCDGMLCEEPVIEVTGTSYSTPYVAAVAAAVLHCTPTPASEVRWKLYDFGFPAAGVAGQVQSNKLIDINAIMALDNCAL